MFRKFFFILTIPCFLLAGSYVIDEANILPPNHEAVIEKMAAEWSLQTKHQIAIITVKSLNGESIEGFSVRKFEELGIGRKGKDDGVLFLIAPTEKKARIEVGYGLEEYLPDGMTGEILDKYVIPHFKTNDYIQGIEKGVYAIVLYEARQENIALPNLNSGRLPSRNNATQNAPPNALATLFLIVVMIYIIIKHPRLANFILISMLFSSGSSRGRSSFGDFGGGFGGFGGGFSGGGGASRGW